jgi:TatA/E family protein of Tat protein translocase
MFGLSFGELLIIAVIALVLFGKEDLPQTLRKFTKGFQEFKKVSNEAQRSWQEVKDDVSRTIMQVELEEEIKKNLREAEEQTRLAIEGGIENATTAITNDANALVVDVEHRKDETSEPPLAENHPQLIGSAEAEKPAEEIPEKESFKETPKPIAASDIVKRGG